MKQESMPDFTRDTKSLEKALVELGEALSKETNTEMQGIIRTEYKKLHAKWIKRKNANQRTSKNNELF